MSAISLSPAGTSAKLQRRSDHPGAAKAGDLIGTVAVFGEHRVGVLAHIVRRVLDRRSAMRELERGQRHPERAIDAGNRVEFMEYAALGEMRVGEGLGHRPHPRRRHMARLEIDL